MPKHIAKRKPKTRKPVRRKRRVGRPRKLSRRGGRIKASSVLSGISAISGGAGSIPSPASAFLLPLSALTGVAGGLAKIFGGRISPSQLALVNRRGGKLKIARRTRRRRMRPR